MCIRDRYSKKWAWMTREIMTEWLLAFDRRMERQNIKVVLFLDNATSHSNVVLNNIILIFLPPNKTSVCQALDQGIIRDFEVYYRQYVLRHRFLCITILYNTVSKFYYFCSNYLILNFNFFVTLCYKN